MYRRVVPGAVASLYAGEATAGAARPFLLLAPTAPETLGFAEAWKYPGMFLYAADDVTAEPDAMAKLIWPKGISPNARGAAWVADPATGALAPGALRVISMGAARWQLLGDVTVPFGQVQLYLPTQTPVAVAASGLTLTSDDIQLQLADGTGLAALTPDDGVVTLAAGPAAAGRLGFAVTCQAWDLYTLFRDNPQASTPARGAELAYTWPGKSGDEQARFPVVGTADAGGRGDVTLPLDAELDPLAVHDGTRTRLRIRAGQVPDGMTVPFASTVAGQPVTLTPRADGDDRFGFWFGRRPAAPGKDAVHLAPLGPVVLGTPRRAPARLMCGLSAQEYLDVADGDVLELVPGQPAYAAGFPANTGGAPVLADSYTTAWVTYRPKNAAAYVAQPGASVSFGAGVVPAQRSGQMDLPAAVASRVRAVTAPTEPFPLVPYGGLALPADKAGPKPDVVATFERQVLAGLRAGRLRGTSALFATAGDAVPDPVFADASGAPLKGGRTTTPQGLVVALNDGTKGPAGTWAQVLLGRSGDAYLSVNARKGPGTVDPLLASTLLREQLFLVVSDWDRVPPSTLSKQLMIADFQVDFAPGTVMVFKYATAKPLRELVATTDAWAAADYFVGDADAVDATKKALLAALAVADHPGQSDPFEYFRTVVAGSPSWTGLLAFNAPVNGNGMAADLQMLFAGIDGPLTAHHMGVEVNRIATTQVDGKTVPDIAESSLFGVVHYPPPNPPSPGPRPAGQPFGFEVQQLDVVIRNSRVTDFHAKVGVTVNQLFGRAVALDPPPEQGKGNTISIPGAYQRHGDVGTVTFTSAGRSDFSFAAAAPAVRVLDRFAVTGASLVPVSSKPNDQGGTDVASRISLRGGLSFRADPFPGITGLDLFSYGRDGAGLPLSNLDLGVTFTLDKNGVRTQPALIAPDLSALAAADDQSAVRAGSLAALLPLRVSGFLQQPEGLDPTKVGGLPVHVLQLEAPPTPPALPGAGTDELPVPTAGGHVTTTPHYAVQLKLPLGSLGALSDVHATLDAFLVLAWGPSTYSPDDDGAALYVQLPQLSAGAFGFNLQGLLKTTFGDANLLRVDPPAVPQPVYVLLFNNVALSLLGFKFPPQVITDFVVFADPSRKNPALGWSLAATQVGS